MARAQEKSLAQWKVVKVLSAEIPGFSVIIPTCNRVDLLEKCLNGLAPGRQTLQVEHYDVIVTDDGSAQSAEGLIAAKFPWVKWVPGPKKGPAANRNNGAKAAVRPWIAFIDDDCIPDPSWLSSFAMVAAGNDEVNVLEGRTYPDRPRNSLGESCPENAKGGLLWSCNLAIRKTSFEAMNGFDQRFPFAAMEDVDFKLRLTERREKIQFVKDASVCHPWRPKAGWGALKKHQASTFIFLQIHPEESQRINTAFYLRVIWHVFFKETLPGILKYRFKGASFAILEHCSQLQMAFFLAFKPKPSPVHSGQVRLKAE